MTREDRAIWLEVSCAFGERHRPRGNKPCGASQVLPHMSGAQDMADYAIMIGCQENASEWNREFAGLISGNEVINCRGARELDTAEVQ